MDMDNTGFYKTDKLYKVLYYIYIRIIHTKITASLPQIAKFVYIPTYSFIFFYVFYYSNTALQKQSC